VFSVRSDYEETTEATGDRPQLRRWQPASRPNEVACQFTGALADSKAAVCVESRDGQLSRFQVRFGVREPASRPAGASAQAAPNPRLRIFSARERIAEIRRNWCAENQTVARVRERLSFQRRDGPPAIEGLRSVADHFDALAEAPWIARVALPDQLNPPPCRLKLLCVPLVSSDIGCELGSPVVATRLVTRCQLATAMLMPEAAVHEDNESVLRQNDVWLSGQITSMQPKSKSHRMERPSSGQLWLRSLGSDARH
jgi:hypothetical protein